MTAPVYNDRASVASLSEPNAEYAEFAKKNLVPPNDWGNIPSLRAFADPPEEKAFELFKKPDVIDSTRDIPMRDGYQSAIHIFKPATPPHDGSPMIVLCHGGGFVIGTNKQMAPIARVLAFLYGATVITPSYRLAPEHKFPAAQNDIWDTIQWAAANASSLGADTSKGFILGGISAGANLTAVMAQKTVGEKMSPPLTGIWLGCPLALPMTPDVQPPKGYEHLFFSREQNAHAAIIDKQGLKDIAALVQFDYESELHSPFNASNPHTGMPRAYFQVDGLDPLRDDGLVYEKVLSAHGVDTAIDVYPGLPHEHWNNFPMLESSVFAKIHVVRGLGWLLRMSKPELDVANALGPMIGGNV